MSRRILRVLAVLIFSTIVQALPGWAVPLTILHANDTHSCLVPFGPTREYGGIARMATLIGQLKANDQNVIVLHAGDASVGTFEFNKYLGYPEFKIMQGLYDAMELGNHELDLGIDTLTGVLTGTLAGDTPITLPMLCANINLSQYPNLKPFVKPYIIKEFDGLKVGVLGVITSDPQYYSAEAVAVIKSPYGAAKAKAAALRNLGCDVVICVSHLGKQADVERLSKVAGIDIIVGGHSHDAMATALKVNGKIIVQAGEFGKYLGELKVNAAGGKVSLSSYQLRTVGTGIQENPAIAATVKALKKGIEADPRFGMVFTQRVATAPWNLEEQWESGNPYRDTPLGNLVADALKAGVIKAGYSAEAGLEAKGYIGHRIYKGKVAGNDVMRAVPYGYDPTSGRGFKIYVVRMFGAQLLAGLEYTVSEVEYDDSLAMQSSGLTFAYDSSKPPAPLGSTSRLDPTSVMIDDYPISQYALYWVALNEKLYENLLALGLEPYEAIDTGLFEYDLVADYMKSLGRLNYEAEGRIIDRALQ